MSSSSPTLASLRQGGKPALARALAAIEAQADRAEIAHLLDEAFADGRAHVLGVTGPPGVGKSTLIAALIDRFRRRGETVGIIAVDPSSKLRGGALLGDRTRFHHDPSDRGVFVRSMAARDELGGLAALAMPGVVLMRALFDRVIVETVGVGQSETAIGDVADTVLFAVQPASGDSLQFMKAGIVEIPHVAVVTKGDLGGHAERAARELEGALALATDGRGSTVAIRVVSASDGRGIDDLVAAIDAHREQLGGPRRLAERRRAQAGTWLARKVHEEFGRRGLARARAAGRIDAAPARPFTTYAELSGVLTANEGSTQSGIQGSTTAGPA